MVVGIPYVMPFRVTVGSGTLFVGAPFDPQNAYGPDHPFANTALPQAEPVSPHEASLPQSVPRNARPARNDLPLSMTTAERCTAARAESVCQTRVTSSSAASVPLIGSFVHGSCGVE